MPQLNENERNFIEESLAGKDGVELYETDQEIAIVKKAKAKKSKKAKKDKLPFLISGIFVLPFILTGIFMVALFRLESFVGGKSALEWLSTQERTAEFQQTAAAAGFSWMPQFLDIYSNRGLIIAITFTIPFLIACVLIAFDVKKRNDEDASNEESVTEDD